MAVEARKSTPVNNADAAPVVMTPANLTGANLREAIGLVLAVNADSIASTYRMCRIPSNARVAEVLLSCDAITTCSGDIGIYQTAANGGAVVDADFFASAQSLASALNNSDVTHEAGVYTRAMREQPLWQALGLSADPQREYDVVVTLTAAAGSGGNVVVAVRYATNQ